MTEPTLATAAALHPTTVWRPNPGRQKRFLATDAHEALWGGEAGGGKSAALVALPLRWVHNGNFRGLILRRESVDLSKLLDTADRLYPLVFPGATVNRSTRVWTFPSGATIRFNHCEHESDKYGYQGDEFHFIGWDELTHFTEGQYEEIRTRLRTTDPTLPCVSRATANPGGPGHAWVMKRFAAWLDPAVQIDGLPARTDDRGQAVPPASEGEKLWFVRAGESSERVVSQGTPGARARTFLRSVRAECAQLSAEYEAALDEISDPVRRAQLKGGDWLKKPGRKDYWDRARITHVDATPPGVVARTRTWDLAGSTRRKSPFTTGARLALLSSGVLVLEHMLRFRGDPGAVRAQFAAVAAADAAFDPRTVQGLPQDPGQAGKDQVLSYQAANPAVRIAWRIPSGDKLTRFGLPSSRGLNGTLWVVRGSWNGVLHDELEGIPENEFWDQADALSDGVATLTGAAPADLDAVLAAMGEGLVRRGMATEPGFMDHPDADERDDFWG